MKYKKKLVFTVFRYVLTFWLALSRFPSRHPSLLVSHKNVPCSSKCSMRLFDFCRLAICPSLSHCQIVFISHAEFRNCPRVSLLSIFNPSGNSEIASQNKSQLLPPCPHTFPDLLCHKTNILLIVSWKYGDFQFHIKIRGAFKF